MSPPHPLWDALLGCRACAPQCPLMGTPQLGPPTDTAPRDALLKTTMKRTSTVPTPTRHLTMTATLLGTALAATSGWAALATANQPAVPVTSTVSASDTVPDSVPGMVTLKGGRLTAGTTPKGVMALMTNATAQGRIRVIDGETPEHQAKVGDFAIGKYEVTNEQYLEFVNATGTRPPEHWAGKAMKDAQLAFVKAEAELSKAALDEGRKYDRRKWTEAIMLDWWRKSWQDVDWGIPKGEEAMAVSYVDYENAVAYARWAGLRLPDEYEWIYAARGSSKDIFPWGNDWENSTSGKGLKRGHTSEIGSAKAQPVGTFVDGASKSGVFDLAGGVFEWTSSPYQPFKKFKPNTYTFKKAGGKEKVTPEPRWNGNFRIAKGGSAQLSLLAARVSMRQGVKRSQTTNAIGIRVASSIRPGVDKAQAIYNETIASSAARTQSETFDYGGVVALDRWVTETPAKRPEGYTVIKGYEHILFAPRTDFGIAPGGELNRESRIQPVVIGFLSTTVPMTSPALPPGEYFVSYREKGRMMVAGESAKKDKEEDKKEGEGEEDIEITDDTPLELLSPAERLLRQIDLKKTIVIFSTIDTGEYVASMPASKLGTDIKATKAKDGEIVLSKKNAFNENKEKIQQDWMAIKANIRRSSSRVIPFSMDLQVDSSALGSNWRTETVSARGK